MKQHFLFLAGVAWTHISAYVTHMDLAVRKIMEAVQLEGVFGDFCHENWVANSSSCKTS